MDIHLQRFIENSQSITSIPQLFECYREFLRQYGFDRVGFAIISKHPELGSDCSLGLVDSDTIIEWADQYQQEQFADTDPIQRLVRASPGCFSWDRVLNTLTNLSTRNTRVFHEARNAGLYSGVAISAHGIGQTKSSTFTASSSTQDELTESNYLSLHLGSMGMHNHYLRLKNFNLLSNTVTLSPREQDVLTLIARGHTKSEISDRYKISVHTVDYHIRNIFQKLDVSNAAAATAIAVQKGLIAV